jgi:hypothetical protein
MVLAASTLVFAWMKCYIPGVCSQEAKECPAQVALVIYDYKCFSENSEIKVNVTIKNKGLFSVDGFLLKANDKVGASIGIYNLNTSDGAFGRELEPEKNITYTISLKKNLVGGPVQGLQRLTYLEVQPFMDKKLESSQKVFCSRVSSQVTSCP